MQRESSKAYRVLIFYLELEIFVVTQLGVICTQMAHVIYYCMDSRYSEQVNILIEVQGLVLYVVITSQDVS